MAAPPFSLSPSRTSLTPRIHHRLPCDIRHRYSRYRPGDLHRPGGRGGTGYGSDAELSAGYLVEDASNISNHGYLTYMWK